MDIIKHKNAYINSFKRAIVGDENNVSYPNVDSSSPYFKELNEEQEVSNFAYEVGTVVRNNVSSGGGGNSGSTGGSSSGDHNHDDRYALKGHNHDNIYAKIVHNHNDLYYTKVEEDAWRNRLVNGDILYNKINANHIQAGSIVAGSTIIAQGAIGNAHISDLSADKLDAGIIDTAKITVQGANGNLKLRGNRLQVFEGFGNEQVERVSLGDVDNDGSIYGLRVRGKDGETILYDENGVYREGITDGSITNDKIGDDANIDGYKLNIASVITSINEDGSETIHGTKIDIDGEGLSTKIYDIIGTQDEHSETIERQQSQIIQNTENINLKVNNQTYQEDMSSMTSRLERTESEIDVLNDSISMAVTKSELENEIGELKDFIATQPSVDISIGGANYVNNSAPRKATVWDLPQWNTAINGRHRLAYWEDYNESVENAIQGYHPHIDLTTFHFPCIALINKNGDYGMANRELTLRHQIHKADEVLEEDVNYVLSFDAYSDTPMFSFTGGLYHKVLESDEYGYYSKHMDIEIEDIYVNTWKRYSFSFVVRKGINTEEPVYINISGHNNPEGRGYIKNIKLEKGNILTQWTPSQFDIDDSLNDVIESSKDYTNTSIKNYSSSLDIKLDGITSRVSATESGLTGVRGSISEVSQKADSISSRVTDLSGKYTEIKQEVDGIDITGKVDFYDLKTNGWSQIHGGNIITDTISVNTLKSNNTNPIIKLFPNSDGYCSIDATQQYESGGKGHCVRLKWDKYNYWYVGNNSAGVYLGRTDNNAEGREYDTHFWVSTTHARIKPNKFMIGNGNCRIDTDGGAIRLYTTPDGGLDRGLRINNTSGRFEIRQSDLIFTNVDNNTYKTVAWSDHTHSNYASSSHTHSNYASSSHTHSNYASSSHTHDKVSYNSTKVHCYNGYIVFDAGSAYFRMDNGSNHGGAYKFYPNAGGIDLGSSYSTNNRWRYIFSQNALNTSDIKCKEDIHYLDDNIARFGRNDTPFLDFIKNNFRPATYMYKTMREEEGHVDADRQIGFIANDIIDTEVGQTFLYNFGTEEETDIMYSPTGYTTVVAKALQEEINKREELEQRVKELEQLINKLLEKGDE